MYYDIAASPLAQCRLAALLFDSGVQPYQIYFSAGPLFYLRAR